MYALSADITGPTVCARSAFGTATEQKANAPRVSAVRGVIVAIAVIEAIEYLTLTVAFDL
jgi:hypothetical protein